MNDCPSSMASSPGGVGPSRAMSMSWHSSGSRSGWGREYGPQRFVRLKIHIKNRRCVWTMVFCKAIQKKQKTERTLISQHVRQKKEMGKKSAQLKEMISGITGPSPTHQSQQSIKKPPFLDYLKIPTIRAQDRSLAVTLV